MRLLSRENRRDSFYVLASQAIIILLGVFRALILPRFFSIESFAQWQSYLLYSAYVGVFTLGYVDGVYLRYGSKDYDELPFKELRSSVRVFLFVIVTFTLVGISFSIGGGVDSADLFAKSLAATNIAMMGLHGLLMYLLQITNQLRRFGLLFAFDKGLLFITLCVFMLIDLRDYRAFIVFDIFYKMLVVSVLCWKMKELFWGPVLSLKTSLLEFIKNISIGYYLLLANLLGMVMMGYGRFYLEWFGSSRDFATFSFGISLTGIIVGFIASTSSILYPKLKRVNREQYSKIYSKTDLVFSTLLLASLILYFPIRLVILEFYEKYHDIIGYLNLIIVCTYLQSKFSIVHSTFYKVMKEQKSLFYSNLVLVILLVISISFFNKNIVEINSIVGLTFIIMLMRSIVSEIFLSRVLRKAISKWVSLEFILLIVFILSTTYMGLGFSLAIFIGTLGLWFTFLRKDLIDTWKLIKE